jgi:TrmH family RNA methyltransferase
VRVPRGENANKQWRRMKIKRYKSGDEISYALGMAPLIELINNRPEQLRAVFLSPQAIENENTEKVLELAKELGISAEKNDKVFNILSDKGNCFAIGAFEIPKDKIREGDHIVLVNPSDAGNLGTIMRTAAGFGFLDLAVISPAADAFDPKTVRASMGAVFSLNIEYFSSFGDYRERFKNNKLYSFMLDAKRTLSKTEFTPPFSLIFGNEAHGLPAEFSGFSETVVIPHSAKIDSLNLPIAAGIAMYFVKNN